MASMKGLSLKQAEDLARPAVRSRLQALPPFPPNVKEHLVLGETLIEDVWIFQLYADGERPEDAIVLIEARVDRTTGDVRVVAFPERW